MQSSPPSPGRSLRARIGRSIFIGLVDPRRRRVRRRLVHPRRLAEGHVRQPDRRAHGRAPTSRSAPCSRSTRSTRSATRSRRRSSTRYGGTRRRRRRGQLQPLRADARPRRQAGHHERRADARRVVGPRQRVLGGVVLKEGVAPAGVDQVAIDKATADRVGFEVGDPIKVVLNDGLHDFTLVGLVGLGNSDGFVGATTVVFDHEAAAAAARRRRHVRHDRHQGRGRAPIIATVQPGDRPRSCPNGPRSSPATSSPRRSRTKSATSSRSSEPAC